MSSLASPSNSPAPSHRLRKKGTLLVALLAAAVTLMLGQRAEANTDIGQFYNAGNNTVQVWIAQPTAYYVHQNGYLQVTKHPHAQGTWIKYRRVIRVVKGVRHNGQVWYLFHLNKEQWYFKHKPQVQPAQPNRPSTPVDRPSTQRVDITGKWQGKWVLKKSRTGGSTVINIKYSGGQLRTSHKNSSPIVFTSSNRFYWTVNGKKWTAVVSNGVMTIDSGYAIYTMRRR